MQADTHTFHMSILFISARDSGMDQIMALEHGADDYITKPFQYEVVLAKVRSQLRRAYGSYAAVQQEVTVKNGPMILYPERFVLEYEERLTELTQKEAILVEALMAKAGRVVSREKLLEQMWEDQHFIDDNTLNVYITRVRRKLKELGAEEILETVRGAGYRVGSGFVRTGEREMRLFLKDHQMLVGFYVLQMLLVPCVYWLSGEGRPMKIVLYGMLISTVVLLVYLIIRYFQLRAYYRLLEQPRKLVNEPFQALGNSVVAEAIQQLLHELERNRQNEMGQLRTSKEQQVVFMNRWVHQMKTPLSIIQLTLEDVDDETAGSIQDELDKLRKGLEMVLHSSRLEQFEGDFRVELLSLHEVLRSSIAENRRLFIRRGITPDIRMEGDLQIYSDSKWLRFMFTQILTNAVNYSDSKSGKKVIITGYKQEERTILDIQDEGIGISSEDIHRVFNPYFTGERGRQYHESTGMGLYLVREISARLDNRVELFSEPNEGTLVRFSWIHSKYPK